MENELVFMNNGFLQSLIESRKHLVGSDLLVKLDEVIEKELELALIGAKKALSSIAKQSMKEDNIVDLRGPKEDK